MTVLRLPPRLAAAALALLAIACTPPTPTHGDFTFTWNFDGERSEDLASVDEVDFDLDETS